MNRIKALFNNKKSNKIFCISMQRTGTTSVGDFFRHFNYSVADWEEHKHTQWDDFWCDGNFEAIFNSKLFQNTQVFSDNPFWYPEFYKVLFHRFADAKFVLFTRNSDDWFRSMLHHHFGEIYDHFKLHCKLYRREKDYYQKLDNNNKEQEYFKIEHAKHYKEYYETRNREVIDFFNEKDQNRLIVCDLNDTDKWQKLGKFFGLNIPENFEVHSNRSGKKRKAFAQELLNKKQVL